jgi:histidinol-phosphate/aromatic aminotransferase/cobyric acid decarboxylase-like protein
MATEHPGIDIRRAGVRKAAGGSLTIGQDLDGAVGISAQTGRPATIPNARVRLSLNENALGCSPLAVEAIRRELTDRTTLLPSSLELARTRGPCFL